MGLIFVAALAAELPLPPGAFAVETRGWTWLTADDNTIWYTRVAASGNPSYKRYWLRTEYRLTQPSAGSGPFKSMMVLHDADCRERRSKTLQLMYYTDNNLEGENTTQIPTVERWVYAAPSTVGEAALERACGVAKP